MNENLSTDSLEPVETEPSSTPGLKTGLRVVGMLVLSILIAALAGFTTYVVQYYRLAADYNDFLSASVPEVSRTGFALKVYDRFSNLTGLSGTEPGVLASYARKAREAGGPLPAIVPAGMKDRIREITDKAGRYFPIAFFKSLLDYLKIKSRRDALTVGGIVLGVLFILLLATKIWAFLVTRIIKLVLIVGTVAWLVTLGLYLWPKKAEQQESHEAALARLEVTMLDIAVREYRLEKGTYPPPGNANLVRHLSGRNGGHIQPRSYFDFEVATLRGGEMLDPWGSPYRYNPGGGSANSVAPGFELYSVGPNRQDENGSGDDIIPKPGDYGSVHDSESPSTS